MKYFYLFFKKTTIISLPLVKVISKKPINMKYIYYLFFNLAFFFQQNED